MEEEKKNQNQVPDLNHSNSNQTIDTNYLIPGAIIIAGVIIAGSIYFSNLSKLNRQLSDQANPTRQTFASVESIKPIDSKDHILGNPNAQVKLIEFSDLECPFCKRFHLAIKKLMGEYGVSGQVAFVYRHFPLDQLHSKARKEAVATECANELGGGDKFWEYLDKIFEVTPSNNGLDLEVLPSLAKEIGLDETRFIKCLESNRYDAHIQEDLDDAQNSGGEGTPFNVIITSSGKKSSFSGALPYEDLKNIIEKALKE
jgi:protein-disulfide isomerase